MTPDLWLLVGIVAGLAIGYAIREPLMRYLAGELAYYRKELAIAQDRLVHAWRDEKAIIPPRPIDVKPVEKLPPELQECVEEWESPEAKASEEARLRNLYFDKGWGVAAILKDRENQHP